jgi:hypothetical protein
MTSRHVADMKIVVTPPLIFGLLFSIFPVIRLLKPNRKYKKEILKGTRQSSVINTNQMKNKTAILYYFGFGITILQEPLLDFCSLIPLHQDLALFGRTTGSAI